ncbi:MAG: hypothetical protein VW835_15405 [Rickettsiales bacterium]|jgi:hypothetical protein
MKRRTEILPFRRLAISFRPEGGEEILVWFGIFVIVLIEISLITTPVRVNVFVLMGAFFENTLALEIVGAHTAVVALTFIALGQLTLFP